MRREFLHLIRHAPPHPSFPFLSFPFLSFPFLSFNTHTHSVTRPTDTIRSDNSGPVVDVLSDLASTAWETGRCDWSVVGAFGRGGLVGDGWKGREGGR